jgi:hypothetical protein
MNHDPVADLGPLGVAAVDLDDPIPRLMGVRASTQPSDETALLPGEADQTQARRDMPCWRI